MLFAIVLGAMLGGAGVILLRQWAVAALEAGAAGEHGPVLTAAAFPHLAPPSRLPRRSPRPRRRAA